MKNLINDDLSQRYTDDKVISLLDITSVLDPRFKVQYVNKVDNVLARVKEEGANIVRQSQEQQHQSLQCTQTAVNVTELSEPPRKKKNLGTLFKVYEDEEEESRLISPEQIFNAELERYLSIPKLDKEEEILPWWKINSSHYPHISKLAQQYLCVCATSSASERLFSTSGNIVTPSRSSLKPDKVNMLTFLTKNL